MAFERIRFNDVDAKPGLWGTSALLCLPAFLLGWLTSGDSFLGVVLAFVCFIVAICIWEFRRNHARLASAMAAFRQRGYQLDVQMGTLLIDSKAKVLAFVNLNRRTMDYYSATDILEWEHQWVNSTRTQANAWGDRAYSTTNRVHNALVVKTRNPQNPIYRVPCFGHAMGQTWMAQMSAIING